MSTTNNQVEKEVIFQPFPKQEEFINAVLSGRYSFILYGGAIRGGKTYALLAVFLILARVFPGSRWLVVRKDLPTIKKNLYPSWNKIKPANFIKGHNQDTHTVTLKNGSQIIFFPESFSTDKDLDRWKGLEVNGVGFEEINECQQKTLYKAFERAGSYIIKGLAVQPKPIVVGTCNPTFGWVKEAVYSPWKMGTLRPNWLYIQSRIHDNLPLLSQQPHYLPSLKQNLNVFEYMVFVEGDWDVQLKTGGEALRDFELNHHVRPRFYTPGTPVFLSMDSNVYPYIALTFWQLLKTEKGWECVMVHSIPAEDPSNTPSFAGKLAAEWLREVGHTEKVFLNGDKSTKNRNNIDEQKRSFFQIIQQTLINEKFRVQDKMLSFAPPVSSVLDFVNAIFRGEIPGVSIIIAESNKTAIGDFIETKTDKDGSLLKVRVPHPKISGLTYEKNGHFTDTLKDFIVQNFFTEYSKYLNRHRILEPGGILQVQQTNSVTY